MVAWGQALAEPLPLTRGLLAQRHNIGHFSVLLGITLSDPLNPEYADCIQFTGYIGSAGNRRLLDAGKLDIIPCHYSQITQMIAVGSLNIDVLMIQLAPPDKAGNYSLGFANDFLVPALTRARVVIAEVNEQAPWTYGERTVSAADLHYVVHTSRPALELKHPEPTSTEIAIARRAAELIGDGATLQFGVGALPEAILAQLSDRRDLGVHSGTIGDGAVTLMNAGVITNARKSLDCGVTISTFLMGSSKLNTYAHLNPAIQLRSSSYTHNQDVLGRIDRFVAVNSALEVDITGQINAEVAHGSYIGAVGGAVDFIRGAGHSQGGVPIIALPAKTKGVSRIVNSLSGPVSTPRSDAGVIVTEYGTADLRGASMSQRIRRMIAIAHPDDREELEKGAHNLAGAWR